MIERAIGKSVDCPTCGYPLTVFADELSRTRDRCTRCERVGQVAWVADLPRAHPPDPPKLRARTPTPVKYPGQGRKRPCPNDPCEGDGFMPNRRGKPSSMGCDPCRVKRGHRVPT